MEKRNKITEGIIWKEMILFCLPIAVGMIFQQCYNVVDAVIVGRFVSKQALASVGGSASMISNMVVGFFGGLTTGAGVIIAQYYGEKNKERLEKAIHTAYAFSIIAGILLAVAGFFLVPFLLELMKTPADTLADSTIYLRIYFIGLIATLTYNMGSAIMRSLGDSKRPFYFLLVCSALNIILDLIFVIVFRMGIAGAAIATVLSQFLSSVLTLLALMRVYETVQLKFSELRIHWGILLEELRIGIPGGLRFCVSGITNIMIQTSINSFGTDTTAGWAAYNKVDMIYWMILGSLGAAVTTFVGQNYGAKQQDRVYKSTRTGLMIAVVCSIFIQLFLIGLRTPLIALFTTDSEVITVGAHILRYMVPIYLIVVFSEIPSGALRGMGYATVPMFIDLFALTCRIPWLLLYVPKHHELDMVLISYPIAGVIGSIMMSAYYLYIKKKHFTVQSN